MTLTGRRLPLALCLATMALSRCSRDQAEINLTLARTPSAYLFRSHGIAIGWILQFDLVLQEQAGVGVRLEQMEISAVDRGTAQTFGPSIFERVTLEQVGLTELAPRGRVTYAAQLGLAPAPPQGPIAIVVQVLGTDAKGNAVSARLDADYPLAPLPPTPLP